MDSQTPEQITRQLFDLFVDDDRLRLAGRLIERDWAVSELARELDLKPQSAMNHLSRLDDAGLLSIDDTGDQRRYRFNVPALRSLNQRVRESDPRPASPASEGAEGRSQKILSDFFDGPRLKTIPAQRDKRRVICGWLASQFAPGVDYPERDVNDILKRHHPDFASLRRELVDEGFMSRDHGLYCRVTVEPARSDAVK